MVQLTIKVTKEVLMRSRYCGDFGAATSCAIAVAVRDVFPDAYVYEEQMFPDKESTGNAALEMRLPMDAQAFISVFDTLTPEQRTQMPELEFTINIPDAVIDRIDIDEIRPLLVNHPTLTLIEA